MRKDTEITRNAVTEREHVPGTQEEKLIRNNRNEQSRNGPSHNGPKANHNGTWAPVRSSIAHQASGAEGVSLRSHPVWKATRGQEELMPLRGQPHSHEWMS